MKDELFIEKENDIEFVSSAWKPNLADTECVLDSISNGVKFSLLGFSSLKWPPEDNQ